MSLRSWGFSFALCEFIKYQVVCGGAIGLSKLFCIIQEMRSVLGAYVAPKDAPFPSLAKHMLKLCSLPHPDEEELLLPASKSRFQEELKACLEEAKRRTWTDSDLKQLSQFSDAHARCVKIVQSDAAEKPENPTILASPRTLWVYNVLSG